jgi:hypothetical protein
MPNTLAHGWIILLLGYGLTVAGLISGLRFSRALTARALWAFASGVPVFIAGIIAGCPGGVPKTRRSV